MVSTTDKDINILKQISKYFNEETLKIIVAKEKNIDKNGIEILYWSVEKISGKGDNYLSVVNRLHVKSKINNLTNAETRLIVKSLPENIFTRKLLRSTEYFYNEIIFYTEVNFFSFFIMNIFSLYTEKNVLEKLP